MAYSEKGKGLRQEITGIILLALSLYLAVSLFSSGSSTNWGGVIGGKAARYSIWTFGYSAYLIPFIVIFISFGFLLRRILTFRTVVPISFLVFLLASSSFLGAMMINEKAGGFVGNTISGFLIDYIGYTGSFIIFLAIILISFLLATGISFVHASLKTVPAIWAAMKWVFSRRPKFERKDEGFEEYEPPAGEPPKVVFKEKEDKTVREKIAKASAAAPTIVQQPKITKAAKKKAEEEEEEALEFNAPGGGSFQLPPLSLLDPVPEKTGGVSHDILIENSKILEKKLLDFGIEGRVLEVRPGPVVTMYEFEPAPGIKVNKITSLSDDLALALKAMSIRIIAPIPGKSVVGIEVPNPNRETIAFREMLDCPQFSKSRSRLSLALGKDISGNPYVADLQKMPHLLVAGATGTGKSVSVNAIILSILYKATPEDARFLMVDPKMLELSAYEGIPHLITPVITDPKKAAGALKKIVDEMGKRYKLMALKGAKNIEKYNQMLENDEDEKTESPDEQHRRLPYIVVIIDELADLMMTSGKEVEECLVRLSQMARASGIHLLVATQRPSVDVVTGLIKTNFPARIAFQLPSKTDSRTILDAGGAETLLGQGDMLFLPPGTSKLQRVHGVYVSETEIKKVTEFWKKQGQPMYDNVIMEDSDDGGPSGDDEDLGEEFLRRYDEAVAMAAQLEMISTSYIQRRFRIGYNTAARIIEKMEKEGVVGPAQGSRPRKVLLRKEGQ